MSLKKKVLNYLDKSKGGQGSLIAVVAASVILSVIVASATQWYLAFNKNLKVSGDSLTGMSIAKDIWDKMTSQDFEEMKAKAGTTESNNVGGYTVTKEYGQAGVFNESTGECKVGSGSPTADNPRACMDVTIKVSDKDGNQIFTASPTRVSQNLGNYYVKNDNFPKEFKVKMEDKDESAEIPAGKALYAYVGGQKVPLSSQGGGGNAEIVAIQYNYSRYRGNESNSTPVVKETGTVVLKTPLGNVGVSSDYRTCYDLVTKAKEAGLKATSGSNFNGNRSSQWGSWNLN